NGQLIQTGLVRQSQPGMNGLNGINALAWNDGATHLLVTAAENESLAAFARNPATGNLSLTAVLEAFEVGGGALSNPAALTLAGSQILVGSASGAGVDAFSFDPLAQPPVLQRQTFSIPSAASVSALRYDEDQSRLYLASQSDDSITL